MRGLLGNLLQEAEEGKEVHQGRLRVEREEGEVREAEESQQVQTGGLQVEEEQGEVPLGPSISILALRLTNERRVAGGAATRTATSRAVDG